MSDTELVKALSEEVRCNVCLELFEDPRVLECLHTFCVGCITQIARRSQGRSVIDCPLCRNVTFLGPNHVNGLKKNHYLANIAEKLKETIKKGATASNNNNNNNNNNSDTRNIRYPSLEDINFPRPSAPPLYPEAPPSPLQLRAPLSSLPPLRQPSPYQQRLSPPARPPTPPATPPPQRQQPPPPPPTSSNRQSQAYLSAVTSFFSSLLYGSQQEPQQAPPPANQQEDFFFVPFSVIPFQTPTMFSQWAASLWLLPSDFSYELPLDSVTALYVPFWIYDVTVNSKCTAKVSRTDADPRDNGRAATENWLTIETSYRHVHPKLMICAAVQEYEPEALGLVEQLDWKLDDSTVRTQHGYPLDTAVANPQGYDVIWHEVAEKIIRSKEREKCEFDLKSQPLIANVKEVNLEINFLNVEHRLIHFPVYIATYTYGGGSYKWVCNGITGGAQGGRPYGLGKLGDYGKKGFDMVSGLIFNK